MKTILATFLTLLLSNTTLALGVSEITVNSQLGEPLSAQVSLTNSLELDDSEIIVRQAPVEIYQQLGIERSTRFRELNFQLTTDRTLIITTRDPINEPFLNFVLEFHWPEGKLYREFKLLIDP